MECSTHFCLKSTYSKIWTMCSEDLQHIANNLPDSFTDYKGVTQSCNPAKYAWKSGGTNKIHSTPRSKQRGGRCMVEVHQDSASRKQGYQGLWISKCKLTSRWQTPNGYYTPSGRETSTNLVHSAHNDRDIGIPDSIALGNCEQSLWVTIFLSTIYIDI